MKLVCQHHLDEELPDRVRQSLSHGLARLFARQSQPSAEGWLKAFDSATSAKTLIIQDVLLCMNAHSDFDLPFAIET